MCKSPPPHNKIRYEGALPSAGTDSYQWLKVTVEIDWDYLRYISDTDMKLARLPWVRERAVSIVERGVKRLFLEDAEREV